MKKYYIVAIQNILEDDKLVRHVCAVEENDDLFEILTSKKIYMLGDKEFNMVEFLENDYSLIGVSKSTITSESIAKHLYFMTEFSKKTEIDYINQIEESIKNSINNNKKVLKLQKK